MYQTFSQQLQNLPKEILSQPRFFKLFGKDKGRDILIANSMFAGDKFILKGETHENTDFISAYDVADGIHVKKIDELKSFIRDFKSGNRRNSKNIAPNRVELSFAIRFASESSTFKHRLTLSRARFFRRLGTKIHANDPKTFPIISQSFHGNRHAIFDRKIMK